MKTRQVVSLLSILLVVFVTLAAAGPAHADRQITHTRYIARDISSDETWSGICAFDLAAHVSGSYQLRYWTDENGNGIKAIQKFSQLFVDFTGPTGKMVSAREDGSNQFRTEYGPDTITVYEIFHLKWQISGFPEVFGGGDIETPGFLIWIGTTCPGRKIKIPEIIAPLIGQGCALIWHHNHKAHEFLIGRRAAGNKAGGPAELKQLHEYMH